MTCEPCIFSPEPVEGCSQTLFLATTPSAQLSRMPTAATFSGRDPLMDGSRPCMSITATCASSTPLRGPTEWIASQRASLARMCQPLAAAPASLESEADLSGRSSGQLTLFGQDSSGSKIPRAFASRGVAKSSPPSWRVDIPGETESLPRLTLAPDMSANAGGSLLPTLTVCGNWNRKGAIATSGDGLVTALKRLPTLCATDYKSPYSEAGYLQQTQKRSKPLRDTLVHTTGHRLTPAFAEWWMGWPLGWTASSAPAMGKSRSRRLPRGSRSRNEGAVA